jgi:hypothetical protein
MEQRPSREPSTSSASQENQGLLPHLLKPATCYPEADRPSLCPKPTARRSVLILSSYLRLSFPRVSFPQVKVNVALTMHKNTKLRWIHYSK